MVIESLKEDISSKKTTYVYGIQGIADFLHVSKPTAQRIKSSGIIDDSIYQVKNTIMVDVDAALELIKKSKWGQRGRR